MHSYDRTDATFSSVTMIVKVKPVYRRTCSGRGTWRMGVHKKKTIRETNTLQTQTLDSEYV